MENHFLRCCREAQKLTPKDVATKLYITPAKYLQIENGEVLPEFEQMMKLAVIFKVHYSLIQTTCFSIEIIHHQEESLKILRSELSRCYAELGKSKTALASVKNIPVKKKLVRTSKAAG